MLAGGGGSMQGANTSLNNNKKLLRKKKYFKKERSFFQRRKEYLKASGGTVDLGSASKEDLLNIRKKIIRRRTKKNLIYGVITILVLAFFGYLTISLATQSHSNGERERMAHFKKKETEFLWYIAEGDEWFKQSKWHNSIFNYEKAKSIFKYNYDINYRLANAYSLQCEYELKNCNTAKLLLDSLFVKFPDKKIELMEIKGRLSYEY